MFHSEFTLRANLIAAMRAHQLRLFDATLYRIIDRLPYIRDVVRVPGTIIAPEPVELGGYY